jgi:hypothetical protein
MLELGLLIGITTPEDLIRDEKILGDLLYSWKQEYKKGFNSLFEKAVEFHKLMEEFEVTHKKLRESQINVVTEIAVFRAAYRDTTEMLQKIMKDKMDFPHKYKEVQLFNAESLDFITYCLDSWCFAKKNGTNPSECREMRDKTLNMIKRCIFDVRRLTRLLTSEIELLKNFNNFMKERIVDFYDKSGANTPEISEEEIKKILHRIKRVYKLLYHSCNWRFSYSTDVTIQECGIPPKSNIPLLYS